MFSCTIRFSTCVSEIPYAWSLAGSTSTMIALGSPPDATQDATPFSNGDFSTDSDAAYTAAAEKAAAWLAKNADKPVTTFALGQSARLPAPMWYIMWGDNKKGGFAVYVNAATGKAR